MPNATLNTPTRRVDPLADKADSFVDEIARYCSVAWDHPTTPELFEASPGTRDQHARRLRVYRRETATLLRRYPRDTNEGAEHWCNRVRSAEPDSGKLLGRLGRLRAIVDRFDDEAELERMKREDAAKAERRDQVTLLRSHASPSVREIAQLNATIEAAKKHEEFIARVFDAFAAHTKAQAARQELARIFDSADTARAELSRLGEQVPDKPLKRPSTAQPPVSAVELSKEIQRVNKLLPTR
jgi:hypothetical protein